MHWNRVCLESIGYELPEERVTTADLERRLEPVYRALHLGKGQIEALTGVRERRFWPQGTSMSDVATRASRKALDLAGVSSGDIGTLIYAGVSRDNLEPATACAVAEGLGVGPEAIVFDISNACLGVLNGMVDIANQIELGQIRAGMVVSAESPREINESSLERLLDNPNLEDFRYTVATFTGGGGAVGVVLTDEEFSFSQRRLLGGVAQTAPEWHRICRWGPPRGLLGQYANVMNTDAPTVLKQGLALGGGTWARFTEALGWRLEDVDKVICHQVGSGHRRLLLQTLGLVPEQDFATFETLGNVGTVSLPITAALAEEAGFFAPGDRVGFLGIGSGLNCVMLGLEW